MRLAFITTFAPQPCGIATYTGYLINGLRSLGKNLRVRVVAEDKAAAYQDSFLEVLPIWHRNTDFSRSIIENTENFDVVHLQHEFGIFGYDQRTVKTLGRLKGVGKKVITFHCLKPGHFSDFANIEDHIKKLTDLVDFSIVHLPAQQAILQRIGVVPRKVRLIPHGTELIDIDPQIARQKLNLPVKGKILLMFGFVKPHKGYELVLDSLKEIVKCFPNTYFFIAGGLPAEPKPAEIKYLNQLKRKIRLMEFTDNVIFANKFFANQDVPMIIAAADVVLFPYYEPDFSASGAFHLAIGATKPVIATRIPKFEELKHISEELLILPNNSQQITKLVIRLFEDREFLTHIIKKTKVYRRLTSWQNIAKKHLELYLS